MATNKNKSGSSTGLRIVWIPGKKKQPKGSYNPTKKNNLSASHQQKRTEPWSLGGSKGQEELLKSEIPGADMASPSIMNCLPQTLGISAACSDTKPEEGAAAGGKAAPTTEESNGHANANGAVHIKTDAEGTPPQNISPPPPPMSPRLGPLANIDEDEHENDLDYTSDDYCGATSNTATLLLKDRKMNKRILPITAKDEKEIQYANDADDDDDEKKKLDMADGVPRMRGLNRKQAMERNYRDHELNLKGGDKGKEAVEEDEHDKKKKAKKTGMNEKVVDCLYVGLTCCECAIQ